MYTKLQMREVYNTTGNVVPRNNEESSPYHCYRAKARRITYSESVSVA